MHQSFYSIYTFSDLSVFQVATFQGSSFLFYPIQVHFTNLRTMGDLHNLQSSSLCNVQNLPLSSSLLGPNIFLNTSFLSLLFVLFLQSERQLFTSVPPLPHPPSFKCLTVSFWKLDTMLKVSELNSNKPL
jgi:hypothetical protein